MAAVALVMSVAPVPTPMPLGGGLVQAWTCTDHVIASPYPTITPSPSPVADALPATPVPQPTTTTVWARDGMDCAVTSWASPYPQPNVSVGVTMAPAASVPPSTYDNTGWESGVGDLGAKLVLATVLVVVAMVGVITWARRAGEGGVEVAE